MASSWLLPLFNVCLLLSTINIVLTKNDRLIRSSNEDSSLQLTVVPNAGVTAENIQIRCEIPPTSSFTSLASSKLDNVYLTVRTDSVKPSGIILMFDDSKDGCQVNRDNIHLEYCNSTLIVIQINHLILNDTLKKIDYSCSKGSSYATGSFRILKDQTGRYFDPAYSSSSAYTHSHLLLLFALLTMYLRRKEIR